MQERTVLRHVCAELPGPRMTAGVTRNILAPIIGGFATTSLQKGRRIPFSPVDPQFGSVLCSRSVRSPLKEMKKSEHGGASIATDIKRTLELSAEGQRMPNAWKRECASRLLESRRFIQMFMDTQRKTSFVFGEKCLKSQMIPNERGRAISRNIFVTRCLTQ